MTDDARELGMTETLALLSARGFDGDFHVVADPSGLTCASCRHWVAAADASVVELFRFEGESDPADEAIVVALRCSACGHQGTLVAGFGPSSDPAEAKVLGDLTDHRSGRA